MSIQFADFVVPIKEVDKQEELLAAIAELRLAISMGSVVDYGEVAQALENIQFPSPIVQVDPVDLSPIILAIESIQPPVIEVVPPDDEIRESLTAILESLKKLDFRLKGVGGSSGGGPSNDGIEAGLATVHADLLNVQRSVDDQEERIEYNTQGNAIYLGKADDSTATSSSTWYVKKLTYSGSNVTRIQNRLNIAWDDRDTVDWG